MTKISLEEIETIFDLIVRKLKYDNLKDFEFSTDEYWIVLADEWSDFNVSPIPAVGSLKEDIEYLRESLDKSEIVTYSDLDRIATVLRAISEQQAPSNM